MNLLLQQTNDHGLGWPDLIALVVLSGLCLFVAWALSTPRHRDRGDDEGKGQ